MIGAGFRNWRMYLYMATVAVALIVINAVFVNETKRLIPARKYFSSGSYDVIAKSRIPYDDSFVYDAVSVYSRRTEDGGFGGNIDATALGVVEGVSYRRMDFFHATEPMEELPQGTALVSKDILQRGVRLGQTLYLTKAGKEQAVVTVVGSVDDTYGLTEIDLKRTKGVIVYNAALPEEQWEYLVFDSIDSTHFYSKVMANKRALVETLSRQITVAYSALGAAVAFLCFFHRLLLRSQYGCNRYMVRSGWRNGSVLLRRSGQVLLCQGIAFVPVFLMNVLRKESLWLILMEFGVCSTVLIVLNALLLLCRRKHG